jgi:hypothetical protein
MNSKIINAMLCMGLCTFNTYATHMDTKSVLEIVISDKGLTRLSVEGDKIEDVFVYPSELEENLSLHKSGNVFVVPEGLKGPLFLSFVTSSGQTQDLKITTHPQKRAAPIILKVPKKHASPHEKEALTSDIMKEFIQGHIPKEFSKSTYAFELRKKEHLRAEPLDAFASEDHIILIFKVSSSEEEPQALTPSGFWREGDIAVTFDHPELKPGLEVRMYIMQKLKK